MDTREFGELFCIRSKDLPTLADAILSLIATSAANEASAEDRAGALARLHHGSHEAHPTLYNAAYEAALAAFLTTSAVDGREEALSEALFVLSDRLRADGFLGRLDHHAVYERVVAAFNAPVALSSGDGDDG